MKILYVTTVGSTMNFFLSYIETLLSKGYRVDIATNENNSTVPDCYREWECRIYDISTSRSPFDKGNLKAVGQLKRLIEKQGYDIVHCHTPIAAMCTRLACRKARKSGTKVIYTAHGFHFYKGAPLKNWLLYYPVEKLCAHFTDVLITINKEDYALAKRKLKAKKVEYVPGVGIDIQKFSGSTVNGIEKRKEIGVPEDLIWILNVGELISRKNQEFLIRAVRDFDNVFLTIVGKGALKEQLEKVAEDVGVSSRVKLLGYRTDIADLCSACDVFAFPSFQEGLPVALMEAMASGKAIVCSRIRGNTDLIDENGGVLFDPYDIEDCKSAIQAVLNSDREKQGLYNLNKIKSYSLEKVNAEMEKIIGGGYCHLEALILRQAVRNKLGIPQNATLLMSVGELNKNKNHEVVIKAMNLLNNPNIFYIIAGKGVLEGYLNDLIKQFSLERNIRLLGYRNDIAELYKAADICVFPSIREGLGLAAIEGMATGLPLIAADNRGTRDFCQDGVNGFMCDPFSPNEFAAAFNKLVDNGELCEQMSKENIDTVKQYNTIKVNHYMTEIYNAVASC